MKKIIITLILSFFLFTNLLAEIANKIKITGNNRISNETINVYGGIEIGKNYNEIEINKILNNLYAQSHLGVWSRSFLLLNLWLLLVWDK